MASPNDRRTTVTVPVPCIPTDTDEGKLAAVRALLEYVLQDRLSILRDEAETISNDMQALAMRITLEGHNAELTDIRSNRWYRTAAQISCLRKVYAGFCEICGIRPDPVHAVHENDVDPTRDTGTVDAITDEQP